MWITGSMGGVLSRGAIEAVSVLVLLQIINFMAYVACHCLTATLEKCACESWRRFSFFNFGVVSVCAALGGGDAGERR